MAADVSVGDPDGAAFWMTAASDPPIWLAAAGLGASAVVLIASLRSASRVGPVR